MRKLGWYAVSATVIALILGGVLLLGANLYVQSVTVQHRIREALTSNLKMPVTLRKTTITPWDGLRIDGIVARTGIAPAIGQVPPPDFLVAESFRVRFALLPLLARRFVIRQVLLDHPQLAWPQDGDGRWQFPPQPRIAKPKAPRNRPKQTPPPVVAGPPEATPPPGVAVAAPATPEVREKKTHPEVARQDFAVAIDLVKLRHGTLNFLDSKDRLIGRFEEVNVDGHLPDIAHVNGEYWFGRAALPRADLVLTNFHGNFAYVQDTQLNLAAGHGELAGGEVLLTFHLQMDEPGSPFNAECHLENVSLARLFAEAGSKVQPIEGRLEGNLTVSGLSGDPASREASGHFQLVDTHLKNLPLLQAVGGALRIEDLSHLEFRKAEVTCQLHGTTLDIEPLILQSRDFQIIAHGQYLTDEDRLDIHGRLIIDQAVSHQLPQFVETNFTACGDDSPDCRYLDFTVTGPLAKPSTDLFDRALAGPMQSLFGNLLAPKPKNGNKKNPKHKDNSEPPADTPANNT